MQKICIINKSGNKSKDNIIKNKSKGKKKIVVVMALFMMLLNITFNKTYANDFDEFGKYHVYSYSDSNRYIKYQERPQRIHEYYYINSSSKQLPAYCMNLGLNGAETVEGGYDVDVSKYLDDVIVNNIILNGYPYKTVEELGLANESEARYATQFALWIKLNNLDINQITPMETEYIRVVNAIKNIYYNGINSQMIYTSGVKVEEVKNENLVDSLDESYYSKLYKLEYGENILDINLEINGIKDYIITDEKNNKIDKIVGNTTIKILFPRNSNEGDLNFTLNITSKYKESAVLFAKSSVNGMQDLSLTLEPIKENNINLVGEVKEVKTKLNITKKDADNESICIPNVKFDIYDSEDNILGSFVTDKDGKINIDVEKDLKTYKNSKIKIKEVEVPYPYIIDLENSTQIIELKVGNEVNVEFRNNKIEEQIKVELPKTGF